MSANIDKDELIASLGGQEKVAQMSHEQRADAIEDYQTDKLNTAVKLAKAKKKPPTVAELDALIDKRQYRRGEGKLFRHPDNVHNFEEGSATVQRLPRMPAKPTLQDFFRLRFGLAPHLLQSAALARRKGLPEETVLACLLHDMGGFLMKTEHGYFGAQLVEPYVPEKVAFAIRYHQSLRFFPDPSVNYEYPTAYFHTFGVDYEPSAYIKAEYEFARNHQWYMEARQVTLNDLYAFDELAVVHLEEFEDIIGRHFKTPEEGLGFDHTPATHMWRAMINPDAPL